MPTPAIKSLRLPAFFAWTMFLFGAANALLIWSDVFVAVPLAVLLIAGGLFGTAGILTLGFFVWAFWGVLGLLLAHFFSRQECQ
ncbi:hypothetical protein [Pseudomonas sp. 2FE]|uniref:hypothetical protein n=1 Tax=Pseudomonas sp. 2FE TaxID=2502190 RepID=UPI0010F9531C|nr:hypothetical protein [Pseudomonas sp. 2FE]